MRPLIKNLMATKVGGREGEANRAAVWDQGANEEGEEILDSR